MVLQWLQQWHNNTLGADTNLIGIEHEQLQHEHKQEASPCSTSNIHELSWHQISH